MNKPRMTRIKDRKDRKGQGRMLSGLLDRSALFDSFLSFVVFSVLYPCNPWFILFSHIAQYDRFFQALDGIARGNELLTDIALVLDLHQRPHDWRIIDLLGIV